ncbi:U6 snRNA-associated Sm-like protein LSm7 [Saccharata proteae CBS 121410]|uniref:U6 snRNA-associated Sm-like protein LSm7 n=1 Tax=Saccharata proteae CBS 121410 TaxID=1314787 RepID=A0A9P4LYI5_9PEZI|nr:U6 snRNA-associated Sm-like protein LSm7 [Saccharata proteae CBS 121410]
MSERGHFRGGRGGGRGGRGGARGGGHQGQTERPKKENILDLGRLMDKEIMGYDQLMNLVLDDCKELMRDDEGNEGSRDLGVVIVRGTLLVLISPTDGSKPLANPFAQNDDDDA